MDADPELKALLSELHAETQELQPLLTEAAVAGDTEALEQVGASVSSTAKISIKYV